MEILAKFSYSVNPRLNKVYVCMTVYVLFALKAPRLIKGAHNNTVIRLHTFSSLASSNCPLSAMMTWFDLSSVLFSD